MAERLRREIRNLLGFSRAGSSPAGVVSFLLDQTWVEEFNVGIGEFKGIYFCGSLKGVCVLFSIDLDLTVEA